MKLSGIFAAISTPFDKNGDLYIPKIHHNVGRWNRTTLSGYLVCGPAGEGSLLSSDETLRVWEETAGHAKAEAILLAFVGGASVRETVQLANRAADMGYRAVIAAPPSAHLVQWKPAETWTLFYRTVADKAKIPVMIDHSPDSIGADLAVDTLAALAEHPDLIGVNDSVGDFEKLGQLISATPTDFQVLTGCPDRLAPALIRGVSGAILAFAGAVPFRCLNIEEAVRTRDHQAALQLQKLVSPAADAITNRYGVAGLKYAMDLKGYYGGPPRLPLLPISEEAKRHIEALLREINC